MLRYNNWSIEQDQWLPATEADLEQQLTFTNDYLCQTAHFEEHFSGSKRCCTYIKGIENPVLNISAISVRLQDERLDLAEWDVQEFYRCLHKNQPMLERRVLATSPKGHTIELVARRQLLVDKKEAMRLEFSVRSVNYSGPITILSVLRGDNDVEPWFTLTNYVGDDYCWLWSHIQPISVQVCCAMRYQMFINGQTIAKRPIKIEKQEVIGYSLTQHVTPNDVVLLHKDVVVLDSLNHGQEGLIDKTLACLTNW